jgi:hypothetical protein
MLFEILLVLFLNLISYSNSFTCFSASFDGPGLVVGYAILHPPAPNFKPTSTLTTLAWAQFLSADHFSQG